MAQYDVIVVGGGLSGWIAAALLGKGGRRVLLVERATTFGGRAATVEKGGVYLNLGAHAVYRDGDLWAVLDRLGIRLPGGAPKNGGHFLWAGKVYPMPASPASLALSPLLDGRGKLELALQMAKVQRLAESKLPGGSLQGWLEENARDPMVHRILRSVARTATYADEPDLQAAGPVLRQLKHVLNGGAFYVDWGWVTIVEQLRSVADGLGVRALAGRPAVQVAPAADAEDCPRDAAYAVDLDGGERLYAGVVVLAAPPAACCQLVPGAGETALGRWREQARPVTVACLDLGLRRLPRPERGFVLGLDEPFLLSNQSRASRLSRSGLLAVHLVRYHGAGTPDAARDRTDLERFMDQVQPGWRAEVEQVQYLPRMTVVYDYAHTARAEAPGPAVPELPGLYVAGDWAGHGELLADAAAASAVRAAGAILAEGGEGHRKPIAVRRLQPV